MSRYLEKALEKAFSAELMRAPDITELSVNSDLSAWVERAGSNTMSRLDTVISKTDAHALARDLSGDKPISEKHPLSGNQFELFGSLWRAQVVVPPALEAGVAFSLRRSVRKDLALEDLLRPLQGSINLQDLGKAGGQNDQAVFDAYDRNDFEGFLRGAIHARWNIILAGGTSTGKTTWLNAMLKVVARDERILTIEDVIEIQPQHKNKVELLVCNAASSRDLLKAALRLRPERIFMGELRGAEAFDFLSAINSGHPGGISTLHASSAESAIDRLALMVMQADTGMRYVDIVDYCKAMIDVVLVLGKVGDQRQPIGLKILRSRPAAPSQV